MRRKLQEHFDQEIIISAIAGKLFAKRQNVSYMTTTKPVTITQPVTMIMNVISTAAELIRNEIMEIEIESEHSSPEEIRNTNDIDHPANLKQDEKKTSPVWVDMLTHF